MEHIVFGRDGESVAAQYLENLGYRIVERNFRLRTGEIDLIARFGDTIIFIEVKTRHSAKYGQPSEAVTWQKQGKILRTATAYLVRRGWMNSLCRVDVIEILYKKDGTYKLNHIINAFGLDR